jgi:hypothetical protein
MIGIHRISRDLREFIEVYCLSKNLWDGVSMLSKVGYVEPIEIELAPRPYQKKDKES